MVKPKDILAKCTGFQWDAANLTKNWEKHDVSTLECEQVFFNRPLIVKRDKKHSAFENRYYGLGRTDADRLLFVVFTVRKDAIRIISARGMTPAERKRYRT